MNQEFSTDTEHLSTPQDTHADPFERELLLQLGEMLKILKQGDQPENRRQLQASCQSLFDLNEASAWRTLLQTAQSAIADPHNSFQETARRIIKELKKAGELVMAGRSDEIETSKELRALAELSSLFESASAPADKPDTVVDAAQANDYWLELEESPATDAHRLQHDDGADDFADLFGAPSDSVEPNQPEMVVDAAETNDYWLELEESPAQQSHSQGQDDLDADWLGNSLEVVESNQAERQEDTLIDSAEANDYWLEPELTASDATPPEQDDFSGWLDESAIAPSEELSDDGNELSSLLEEPDSVPDEDELSSLLEEPDSAPAEASSELADLFDSAESDLLNEWETNSEWGNLLELESEEELPFLVEEDQAPPIRYPDFDELEFLLDSASSEPEHMSFEQLESWLDSGISDPPTLDLESSAPVTDGLIDADEESDLEKLLEEANQAFNKSTQSGSGRQAPATKASIFEQTMRVPVKQLDTLNNLIGELVVNRNTLEQDQERLRQFLDNLLNHVQHLSDIGGRMQDLYERSLLEGALLATRSTQAVSTSASLSTADADDELGALEMDRFTGFHLLSQEMIELIVRVRESSSDIQFLVDDSEQVARSLRQVTTQLQEELNTSRMIQFGQTADRLPRAIREISRKLNKQAQLHVEGRDALIDKMILEHLYDPMTHLVNNAITHGIESPQVRQQHGKPPTGRITISAFLQGNQTVISVADDGAGIDPDRVKAKAIEKGLITKAKAKALSHQDIYEFLFHPGFSTKDQADDFAGRGVGMDVVQTSLEAIRGSISIDSTLGEGTKFTIRLPLTLSICKALCCVSRHARIAFPMDGVEDMQDYQTQDIQTDEAGQPCVQWRNTLLPFRPLKELLVHNRQVSRGALYSSKQDDDTVSIVVLQGTGNRLAIQVDQVLGEQEIVIKQIEGPIPKPAGIAGATVLGDGSVMPIGDVIELIEIAQGRRSTDSSSRLGQKTAVLSPAEAVPEQKVPLVLIVDDSITVRELLSISLSKAGYRVEQARDGQEGWDKISAGLPVDIVFCDVEMPRMNGLELLSRLQKEEDLAQIPVALLTSRGADRHRKVAAELGASGYFTKPYTEKVILDSTKRMLAGEVLLANSTRASAKPTSPPPEELEDPTESTVLIIDDSVMVREMLSMTFKKAGYQVEQARDGQEAWEKLSSGLSVDLAFCDLEMPRMNGFDLLSRLQQEQKLSQIPVAMITSRGSQRHRKMARERGAKGYFTKPYIEGSLVDAAERLIAGEDLLKTTDQGED